ncbi:MAG: radical SAM protein [Gemmataceae bacterium]|nr:radical SAM protein [Gemmataceae bacterium]
MEPTPAILFKDQTALDLAERLAHLGATPKLTRKLQSHIVRNGQNFPKEIEQTSWRLLKQIEEATRIPSLELLDKRVSPRDGFAKYLFRGEDDQVFETVRIPLLHRPGDEKYVMCVSSQVGCAMGCAFCATGKMGFRRNLQSWEIVDQVIQVQKDSHHPVRGVVFMGMGEPMLNYDRVMKAAEVLCEPCGLAIQAKNISISTVGIVPAIRRFTRERKPYRLVISLTAAESGKRKSLLPVENVHPLEELMEAVREYQAAMKQRVMFAWTMISGFNLGEEDALQIARLTAGMRVKIDLIDVNDPSGQFQKPTMEELHNFRSALSRELGQPFARRYSGGQDIDAGCGMLAGLGSLEPGCAPCVHRQA